MNAKRFIAIFIIILTVAFSANWFVKESESVIADNNKNNNEPDLYMKNPIITQYREDGLRQHNIIASKLTHYPVTDITTMESPSVSMFSQGGTNPWNITSKDGQLTPKSNKEPEIVELWGDVLAQKIETNGDFVNIQSERMTLYPDADLIESNEKVLLDDTSGRTTAGAMRANLANSRYAFFTRNNERVLTILLPTKSL